MASKFGVRDVSKVEIIAKLALLGREDREVYRELRALLWQLVVDRSRSDIPSKMS
jgi:hypothetical protein